MLRQPMLRQSALALAAVTLAACVSTTFDPERFPPVSGRGAEAATEERARAIAADLGLTVQSSYVQRFSTRFRSDEDDPRTDGYTAWLTVEECPTGNFVVKTNHVGQPISTFTRYGCELPGVPSF